MEDAFIYAKRPSRERRADRSARRGKLDQPPMTQRGVRRERAPMRLWQRREHQTKRWITTLRVSLRGGARGNKPGVELHPRAHQNDVALEWREAKELAERLQR